MEPKDLLNPRIFLCKTGRFINNFVANNLGKSSDNGEDEGRMKKEPFVNENFENSCEEKDLETIHADLSDLEGSGSGSGKDDCVDFTDEDQDAIIQSNPDLVTYNNCKQPQETVSDNLKQNLFPYSYLHILPHLRRKPLKIQLKMSKNDLEMNSLFLYLRAWKGPNLVSQKRIWWQNTWKSQTT